MQVRTVTLGLLVVVLAACSVYREGSQPEANIVAPGNFHAGSGMISSVAVLPNANKKAAAGSTDKRPDPNLYRISVQMDAGGFQQVDVDSASFMEGQAVELTNDGRLVHLSGTTLNKTVGR